MSKERTPLVTDLPRVLVRADQPPRTPVINGVMARQLTDLVQQPDDVSEAEVEVSLKLNEISPEAEPIWAQSKDYLHRSSLAFFFSEVISGPKEHPYDGKSLVGKHHEEWDQIVCDHERVLVEAARDHGKCRPAGSLTVAADGRRIPIEKWSGGELIGYDQDSFELKVANSTPSRCVGIEPCLRITTRTGRQETVAEDHQFATIDGWRFAKDLEFGERIACPRTLPVSGSHALKGNGWFLGLIVGDGGVDSSPNKRIPAAIFTAPNDDVADFLAGWTDADGHVSRHAGGSVEIYTASEELARDGLHILTRLGVVAVLSPRRDQHEGEDRWPWRLVIRGRSIVRFARQVKLRGCKGVELAKLAAAQEPKEEGGSKTEILWDEVVDVESVGELPVYAIQVPGLESYVGQDIISHNSHFFSLAYPIWMAGLVKPGSLGYIFSSTQDTADALLTLVKEELLGNPKLAHLIPSTRDRLWSKKEIKLRTGSVIRARGMGVKVRGGHPDWLVVDDGLTDEDIYSEVTRKRNTDYYLSAIVNMIKPGGQVVVVGTPMHYGDLYGHLKETGEYHCKKYQAIDKQGQILFPERYDRARLEARKREVGPSRFAREFLCCRPGTMIETSEGAVPIEDVTIGMIVLTHRGKWEPVLRTFRHSHNGSLMRIKGRLHVTLDHPVFTQDGFLDASKLVDGDLVTFPRALAIGEPPTLVSFERGCRVPYLKTASGDRMYARGSAKHIPSGSVGGGGAKSIPTELPITPQLLRLFGLWIAEGHIGSGDRLLCWSFNESERETFAKEVVVALRDMFGLNAKINDNNDDGAIQVTVGCRILADYFARQFQRGASNKRIPQWMKDLLPDMLWHLCLSYVDGDGHVAAYNQTRVSSVSRMLLHDVQFSLARCGIFSTIRCAHEGGAQVFKTKGVERTCNVRPSWVLNIDGGASKAFQSRKLSARAYQWGRIHNTLQYSQYDGDVFNLEVANDNSYVADGIAVHNCQPLTDESSLFPSHLFQGGDVRLPYKLGLPAQYWEARGMVRYTGVDFAMSASAAADFTVILTLALDDKGNRWLANIRRGKGWGFQKQLDEIKDENTLMRPDVIHAEANQMQRIFTDEIIRETDIPIRKFFTSGVQPKQPWRKGMTSLTMGKHSLDRGVPSLRMSLENRKWRIPRGDSESIEKTDIWIGEMMAMGWINGNVSSVGDHDDTVMAVWMADAACRMGGFSFSFGEDTDSVEGPGPFEMMTNGASDASGVELVAGHDVSQYSNHSQEQERQSDLMPKEGAPSPSDFGFGGGFGEFG